ncbi:hypothetical protein B0H13DRAFT_709508 [Mycena leptocephala]|nr:hypothetical protein B0H13DRAFT_709508 [Mycena leptocephala]
MLATHRSNNPAIPMPMLDPPCPQRPSRKNTATLDREILDCVLFSADPLHSLESSKVRKRRNRVKKTISNPLNPVHLTHIQFNSATGELSGLPPYYCQLLSESVAFHGHPCPRSAPIVMLTLESTPAVSANACWSRRRHTP